MRSGVTREIALRALRAKPGLYISTSTDSHWVMVADEHTANPEYIPLELERRLVARLSRVYSIPIHWFYNPLMIPGEEETQLPN